MAHSDFPRLTLRRLFNANFYRANNPDLARFDDRQAFTHFENFGVFERRRFSPFFDLSFYQANNPDLTNLGLFANPRVAVEHFVNFGLNEGRPFSPLFDLNFYRANNLDLGEFDNSQLFTHFLDSGLEEGRRFNPSVDLNFYRANNPDLNRLNNFQLLNHFFNVGLNEGRPFLPGLDINFYRANNPDLQDLNNAQLLNHYLTTGIREGRRASPAFPGNQVLQLFDPNFYQASNPDLANFDQNGLRNHFLDFGLNEGRRFSPFFDVNFYRNSNVDLQLAGLNNRQLLEHFQNFGLNEGRRFSEFFDVNYYLANNPDLRTAGFGTRQAFEHFRNMGINEGRRPSILFDPVYYIANNPDLLARGLTFREGFDHFQRNGFQEARPASILFDPRAIAPLVSPPEGQEVESLPEWLLESARWGDIPVGGTLTYSFVTTASAFLYEGLPEERNIREVNPAIKNNIRNIIQQYGQHIGINLVEVPDRPPNVGRIRIMFSSGPASRNTVGYANTPSDSPGDARAGDIHLDFNNAAALSGPPGTPGYQALLFLVGASLGLNDYTDRRGQAGQGTGGFVPDLIPALDNNTNTVMSKNAYDPLYNGVFAITPMSYDIRALQYLYGANTFLNNTDSVYRFNVDLPFFFVKQTIWDAGGIDTLDFSGLPPVPPALGQDQDPRLPPLTQTGYYFDMNEGGHLTAQNALNRAIYPIITGEEPDQTPTDQPPPPPITSVTNIYSTTLAFVVNIENLIGSPGNDEILGNNLPNFIVGGAGDDEITGAGGADILVGGPGRDLFIFARGDGGLTPALADTILDFTPGEDRIGLALGLNLGGINILPGVNPNDTLLQVRGTGEYLATLAGIPVSTMLAFLGNSFVSV